MNSFYPYPVDRKPLKPSSYAKLKDVVTKFNSIHKMFDYRHRYGFVVITNELINSLARVLQSHSVLDVGSGTGYLTYRLAQKGINIEACDIDKTGDTYSFNKIWQLDHNKCATEIMHNYSAVILSWPPYDESMALTIAEHVTTQLFIYQGEWLGGCTADDAFFDYLTNNFDEQPSLTKLLNEYHLQFMGVHDHWSVYRRKRVPRRIK